jgi:hypothetical protein
MAPVRKFEVMQVSNDFKFEENYTSVSYAQK